MYYPSSENNGEADLRLCFRLCRLLDFPSRGSFTFTLEVILQITVNELNTKYDYIF